MNEQSYQSVTNQNIGVQNVKMELELVDQELQSVMNNSRMLLEQMTTLLDLHSSKANRRTVSDRRSGRDRRDILDRRSTERRVDVNPNRMMGRRRDVSCRSDAGRRREERRLAARDRRLPLDARQQLITKQMDTLGERNVFLLRRKRSLLDMKNSRQ